MIELLSEKNLELVKTYSEEQNTTPVKALADLVTKLEADNLLVDVYLRDYQQPIENPAVIKFKELLLPLEHVLELAVEAYLAEPITTGLLFQGGKWIKHFPAVGSIRKRRNLEGFSKHFKSITNLDIQNTQRSPSKLEQSLIAKGAVRKDPPKHLAHLAPLSKR